MDKNAKQELWVRLITATVCSLLGLPLLWLTVLILLAAFKSEGGSEHHAIWALLPGTFAAFFLVVAFKLLQPSSGHRHLFSHRVLFAIGGVIVAGLAIIAAASISHVTPVALNAAAGAISFGAMIITAAKAIKTKAQQAISSAENSQ
ncbi:hypothetical protein [Chitinibacter tainanensis]|uniref:hypothetical protein n=1 Tax=Chitinibacter tainanensis TaxID=230667 RepID=UPI00048C712C|nr:hypothetical protein [Chitinibacter tainanensis]